jgi:transcriptional regulator with XRE-family HTH domain
MVEAMQMRGMTKQHALAFAVGVNESTITRWKKNGPMSIDHVVRLCQTLDISLDWFLNGTGEIDAPKSRPENATADESSLLSCVRRAEAAMTEQSKALLVSFLDSILPDVRTM